MKTSSQERNNANAGGAGQRLRLTLLGGWQLEVQGRKAGGPAYDKGRALLAYLVMEDRWHSREQLAALFWPDAPGQRANLRQVLSNLRGALNDKTSDMPCLLVERQAVRFNPACAHSVDVAAFTTEAAPGSLPMEGKIELYKGEFLAGLALPDCPEFEDWCRFRREFLHRHALLLLGQLADCHAQAGNIERALAFARRYVELEPLNEAGQRRVMHLCGVSGRSLSALQHYESFARLLRDELGVLPEEETRALQLSLRAGRPSPVGSFPPHRSAEIRPPSSARPRGGPERRQVSVLYCELTATGNDLEEMEGMLREPQQQAIALIQHNGGHLVQVHGGGLLAYFGYPLALENAALLALGTSLAIVKAIAQPLQARLGVHTGLIVTSEDPNAPDAVGETSGLAIRLRLLCDAGQVAVSAATRHLVEGYFDFKPLGALALRGAGEPLQAFELVKPSGALGRLEAASGLTPFTGRGAELAQLLEFWRASLRADKPQAVLLRGEPGIGKSRLVWRFKQLLGDMPMMLLELRCRQEHSGTVLHPFTGYLATVCGFKDAQDDEARLDSLEQYLAATHPLAGPSAPCLLARLLGLPTQARYGALGLLPQQEKESLQQLLLGLLSALAAPQPLLLMVKDMHWADPSTLELVARLVVTPPRGATCVLLTARPGFQPAWAGSVLQVDLGPLSIAESVALVSCIDRKQPLTADVLAAIARAADGVPLFMEEMTRMRAPDEGTESGMSPVPHTLHDLLMARIDQLGEAKALAQVAAVIGREFSLDLLYAVSPLDLHASKEALSRLEASGLARRLHEGTTPVYHFKHALIQEAAYQSQTRQSRRQAHRRIAHALVASAAAGSEAPQVLGRHFREAGMPREAFVWWFEAGSEAVARHAHPEAMAHFNQALQATADLPDEQDRQERELQVLIEQGNLLLAGKGYGSLEASVTFTRALALSEKTGNAPGLFRSTWGLYLGCSSRTHHSDAMLLAQQMLRLAQQEGRSEWLIAAHYAGANSAYTLGRFAEARQHMEEARRRYRPDLDLTLLALFGEHVMVSALFFGAWSLWMLGLPGESRKVAAEALTIARRMGHPHTLGFAFSCSGVLHRLLDEPAEVAACGDHLAALAEKHGFAFWQVTAEVLRGWAQACAGQPQGGTRIAAAIDAIRAGVFMGAVMYFVEMLAEAWGMLGMHTEQLRVIDEALEIMERIHARHFEAELYRLKGECLLHLGGDSAVAATWLERAREVARRQGAVTLERRAATSLSRLGVAGHLLTGDPTVPS